MNRKDLCQRLEVKPRQISAWIREGLPHSRRGRVYVFDSAAVSAWLVEQGYRRLPRIVHTEQAVADHLGKTSAGTIGHYKRRGMPWVERPGNQPNDYDLDEIAAWREREDLRTINEDIERAERTRLEKEMIQTKLDQLRGKLVELEPIRRLMIRQIYICRTHLEQLPDQMIATLGDDADAKVAGRIRGDAVRKVDDACLAISEQLADPEVTSGRCEELEAFTEELLAVVDLVTAKYFGTEE